MSHSRFQTARKLLIFWTFFIGLGAVAGAAAMLIDPSGRALGMDAMLPYFQVLPCSPASVQPAQGSSDAPACAQDRRCGSASHQMRL